MVYGLLGLFCSSVVCTLSEISLAQPRDAKPSSPCVAALVGPRDVVIPLSAAGLK